MQRGLQECWRSAQRWHLDLSGNFDVGAAGAERLAGVLGQCRELVHLNLDSNRIDAGGTERLAGVLGQLAHLDLRSNFIGAGAAESLSGVLGQCAALAHLNLWPIRSAGGLQERWRSAERWLTSISPALGYRQPGSEACRSAEAVRSADSPQSQRQ